MSSSPFSPFFPFPLSSFSPLSAFYSPLQRFYKFIFKRLVGRFLCGELDPAQLEVQLSAGQVSLSHLRLRPDILNSHTAASSLPLTVSSASIEKLEAHIPWRSLLTDHCRLHLRGLRLDLTPVGRTGAEEGQLDRTENGGGQEEDDTGDRGGVFAAALDASLSSLDEAELRRHVRLHRQLAATLTAQRGKAGHRTSDEDEKRWAEEEQRREKRRRRRSTRTSQQREEQQPPHPLPHDGPAEAGRRSVRERDMRRKRRVQKGWSVPEIEDSGEELEQMNEEDATPSWDVGDGGGQGEDGGERDADVAAAGLKVVASFLERLISETELTLSDLTIRIRCPHPSLPTRDVALALHIPTVSYTDLQEAAQSGFPSPSHPPPSAPVGPTFQYDKLVSLHGFRLSLSQLPRVRSTGVDGEAEEEETTDGKEAKDGEDPLTAETTIAHGDLDQQCDVRLSINMAAAGRVGLEGHVEIRSIRALLSPPHVQLLAGIADAIVEGSCCAALRVERQRERQRRKAPATVGNERSADRERSDGPIAASTVQPLGPQDFDVIDQLMQDRQNGTARGESDNRGRPLVRFYEMKDEQDDRRGTTADAVKDFHSTSASALVALPLWRLSLHLQDASLTVLEEDEPLRSAWWLEPVVLPSESSPPPSILLSPLIAGISVDHLLLSLHHVRVDVSQTSAISSASITIDRVRVHEYLQQYRLMQSVIPSLPTPAHPLPTSTSPVPPSPSSSSACYSLQQQRMGFSARRLLHFQCDEESGDEHRGGSDPELVRSPPHFRCEIETAVEGCLPIASASSSSSLSSLLPSLDPCRLSSRAVVQLCPVMLDVDLGLMSRLSLLQQPRTADAATAPLPPRPAPSPVREDPERRLFVISAPLLRLTLFFPADTASQSAVGTPLLRDGVSGCFDSRGLVRGERLRLQLRAVKCGHSEADIGWDKPLDDALWRFEFQQATVDLIYPKEDRQLTAEMRTEDSRRQQEADGPPLPLPLGSPPSHWHSKCILSTEYSSTAAPAHASPPSAPPFPPSSLTLTIRAPLPPPLTFHSMSQRQTGTGSTSALPHRSLEEMFLHSLPEFRWFEPARFPCPSSTAGEAVSTLAQEGSQPSGLRFSAPSAAQFEASSLQQSAVVVSLQLSACSLHLTKVEFDLLLLLYTIYDELTTGDSPTTAAASPAVASGPPEAAGAAVPAESFVLSPSFSSQSSLNSNSPQSDSDSDVSELFESVVGAESVFLTQRQLRPHGEQQMGQSKYQGGVEGEGEEEEVREAKGETEEGKDTGDGSDGSAEDIRPLSDFDSECSGSSTHSDDESCESGSIASDSQYGVASLLMGRSQHLMLGDRRVVDSRLASSALTFHSFIDQPPSLSQSTVLPTVSSFVPAPAQPYKHVRATHAVPSPRSASLSHRHRLCVKMDVAVGGICVAEEPVPLSLFSPLFPTAAVPPSSSLPPQSFYLDVGQLQVFACVGFDHSTVSYVSVRAGDGVLYQFDRPIVSGQQWSAVSAPVLFKSLSDDSPPQPPWSHPVFVGQFIVTLHPSLHLRDTTAILNLRGLSLAFDPTHVWMQKLSDFLTLSCPPYVQTAGAAMPLTADYAHIDSRDSQTDQTSSSKAAPPPVTIDLCKLFFHAYSCCLDFNPPTLPSRALVCIDRLHLDTVIHPLSSKSDIQMEMRDIAVLLLPSSLKAEQGCARDLRSVPRPHLHHLPCSSLLLYLEELGCARVVTADYVDLAIRQQDPRQRDRQRPSLTVEVTNGSLEIATCFDSFAQLVRLSDRLTNAVKQARQREEAELRYPESTVGRRDENAVTPGSDEKYGGDDAAEGQRADGAGKGETELAMGGTDGVVDLRDADPQIFGAQCSRPLCSSPSSATSLSLALQAAAEREIEKARRELEVRRSIVALAAAERGREREREREREEQQQASQRLPSDCCREDEYGSGAEQKARWFSNAEMEERQWREELQDSDVVDLQLARKRDEELEEQLELDRERRRKKLQEGGRRVSRRHQPQPPTLIENHINGPPAEEDEDEKAGDHGERLGAMGRGRSAIRRLKLGLADAEPVAEVDLILFDVSVCWKLFDGADWQEDEKEGKRDTQRTEAPKQQREMDEVEIVYGRQAAELTEELDRASMGPSDGSTGASLFHDDYIPIPSPVGGALSSQTTTASSAFSFPLLPSYDLSHLPFVTPPIRRIDRRTDRVLKLHLLGANVLLASFSPQSTVGLHLSIAVEEAEIVDCIASSSFKKLLTLHRQHPSQRTARGGGGRRGGKASPWRERLGNVRPMLRLDASTVRANIHREVREEWRVALSIAPIRLYVDQFAAELLIRFFSHPLPSSEPQSPSASSALFQLFRLSAPLHVCIDYRPHRVSYSSLCEGDLVQLLHLLPFEKLQLTLTAETVTGCALFDQVAASLLSRWADDLTRHQLHRYLSSVQPLRSLINVGSGVVDCIVLPIEQWKRQRKVGSGMRKGVSSLLRNVTVESLNLLMSVTHTATDLLQEVDQIVSGPAAVSTFGPGRGGLGGGRGGGGGISLSLHPSSSPQSFAATPKTLHDGLAAAYDSLSRSLQLAAHQLVAVPREEWKGAGGGMAAVRSVVRHMPHILLGPCIGLTEGLRRAMMGLQATVDRGRGDELDDKYKRPTLQS